MPQSFVKRFAGREAGVVDEIKLFGWSNFCKREGIPGFSIPLQEWFHKQKGCERDSILQYISPDEPISDLSPLKKFMLDIQAGDSKWEGVVANLKDRLAEANQRNESLARELRESRLSDLERFKPLFEFARNRRDLQPAFELCNQPIRGDPLRI